VQWLHIFWDIEVGGNAEHVAEHGLNIEDIEHVLRSPEAHGVSRTSGYPMICGHAPSGEYIAVIYEEIDEDTVYPVTAFVIED
jgi:hypothetical protein